MHDAAEQAFPIETTAIRVTVLAVTPVNAGKLFALAAVEIDIDESLEYDQSLLGPHSEA